jgi:FkbM family methyltransferase
MKLTKLPGGQTIATIEGDTHIGKWAIESGRLDHDQNTLPLLMPFIPEGGTVVDVGAYIGDHTVFYADCVGHSGAVYAMEPNRDAYECLVYNVHTSTQTRPMNCAASNSHEPIEMHPAENAGAAYATPGGTIPAIQIDSLCLTRCDFIKIDCEGMEPMALQGAQKTIMEHRPIMLIEVNEGALNRQGFNAGTIFAILKHYGYAYRNIYDDQPMTGPQYDILCAPLPRS